MNDDEHLARLVRGGEILRLAEQRRAGQAFTLEEEPEVLAALSSALHLLAPRLVAEMMQSRQADEA